jgi:hypothetical protein
MDRGVEKLKVDELGEKDNAETPSPERLVGSGDRTCCVPSDPRSGKLKVILEVDGGGKPPIPRQFVLLYRAVVEPRPTGNTTARRAAEGPLML